jgi:hypothetical protein
MKPETPDEFMRRYPRITGHIIAESLGYATPRTAAIIGLDGLHHRENWCEYIFSCFDRNAKACLERAIRNRHNHTGYMAEYGMAKKLVDHYIETGEQPMLASWL